MCFVQVYELAFSPNSQVVYGVSSDNTVQLYSLSDGSDVGVFTGHSIGVSANCRGAALTGLRRSLT
jgi:WD40 repeat protein